MVQAVESWRRLRSELRSMVAGPGLTLENIQSGLNYHERTGEPSAWGSRSAEEIYAIILEAFELLPDNDPNIRAYKNALGLPGTVGGKHGGFVTERYRLYAESEGLSERTVSRHLEKGVDAVARQIDMMMKLSSPDRPIRTKNPSLQELTDRVDYLEREMQRFRDFITEIAAIDEEKPS
jgi:hypothetical protein